MTVHHDVSRKDVVPVGPIPKRFQQSVVNPTRVHEERSMSAAGAVCVENRVAIARDVLTRFVPALAALKRKFDDLANPRRETP